MSAIFAVLGFVFSIPGLMLMMVGIILFLCLPILSLTSRFKSFSRFFLWLAAFPITRAAIVISEHNDALFRQMKFVNLGYETITIDDELKVFEDPDRALHYWNGLKFALADEEHGVLFDPRHAALGMRKRAIDAHDEAEYLATTEEWERFGVSKWLPGVFEMPRVHELVDLSAVQELVDGGERSEFAERVEELYKNSRHPFESGTPPIKFLWPIIAFAIPFFGIWVMVSQFGSPSNSSTVSFNALWVLLVSLSNPFRGIDWRYVAGLSLLIGVPTLLIGGIALLFNPVLAASITIAVLLGMVLLPLLTFIVQPVAPLAGALSKFYFRLGFLGWRRPVFVWTREKYVLKEYDQLASTDDVKWYNLFGTLVGFTYEPEPTSWDAEPVKKRELRANMPVTDGGTETPTNLPAKYSQTEALIRDTFGGYIPNRLNEGSYYLRSGIALNRFSNSATGQKSLRKLLEAKDHHGSVTEDISDGTIFKANIAMGLLGVIGGISIFILPGFL